MNFPLNKIGKNSFYFVSSAQVLSKKLMVVKKHKCSIYRFINKVYEQTKGQDKNSHFWRSLDLLLHLGLATGSLFFFMRNMRNALKTKKAECNEINNYFIFLQSLLTL